MSILRTSKFVRYIGGLARNIVFNNSRNVDGLLVNRSSLFYSQNYATVAVTATPQRINDINLDRSIKRLDVDARRMGRISRRELEEVIEAIKYSRSATTSQSLMVIRCCGNLVPEESPEFRTKLVNNIWDTLEKLGIPMDISHYNALLRVYLENEHTFSPTEFLSELEKKGIEPNRVTYQRLIASFCQRGDIDGATQILEFMREKQMPISEGVFNALILGHSKAGDMQSARGILSVMGQAGLEPGNDTYSALLCGYASIGDTESLESVIEECKSKEISLLDKDYLEIVYTLAVNNHDHLVDSILKKIVCAVGYNQDASNVILRLTTHGKENIALKVLETMVPTVKNNGQPVPMGGFFIRQLVVSNRPIESILNICDQLKESGLNSRSLLIATEVALQSGNVDLALDLFKAMRDNFYPLRNHYFWPIIIKKGTENPQEIITVLKKMNEFKVTPNSETLRDYVLPYMALTDIKEIGNFVSEMQNCGVSVGASAASLVGHFISKNDIKLAADIASSYKANYSAFSQPKTIVHAFLNTQDVDSFVKLVNTLVNYRDQKAEEAELSSFDNREFVGKLLLSIIGKRNTFNLVELLQKFIYMGLGISNSAAEQIQSQLCAAELTVEVSDLLNQLVSADLTPVPLQRPSQMIPKNEESLRRSIENLKAKGDPALKLKRQLFSVLCSNKDLNKVLNYVKELEAEGYMLNTGMRALLIELYLNNNNLESALKEYNYLLEKEPDLKLDNLKAIKLATCLVQADKFNDAIDFLNKQSREEGAIDKEKEKERPFMYTSACWRLLNTLAEKGDTEGVRKLFDTLMENKFIEPSNVLLGQLVKAHLVKDDLSGAMDVYEWCCQHFRCTPLKNDLACRLIQKENANELQRLTDLSTIVHGEINSLHDLIIAFVECGRVRQARKILETPGLRVRSDRISYAGERYQNEGLVEPLEALLKATKDISQIDRASLYYQLLLSYKKADDVDKALGLWTQMQEEDIQPSEKFLSELGLFLESKNLPVPFVIPEFVEVTDLVSDNIPAASTHNALRNAIKENNWTKSLEAYKKLKNENRKLYPAEIASFLDLAINSVGPIQTLEIVKDWLSQKLVIPRYKLYNFTKSLAKSGDIKAYEEFGNYLSDQQKLTTKYNNLLCNCVVKAGQIDEYLTKFESKVKNASTVDNFKTVLSSFPIGGIMCILDADLNNHLPRVEKIAEIMANNGIKSYFNLLWLYFMDKGQDQKAETIFNEHLKSSDVLLFRFALGQARNLQDVTIVDKLLNYINNWDHSNEKHFGIIYSAKINILVNKEEVDNALSCLEDALKKTPIENINFTALNKLKNLAVSSNKNFSHNISHLKRQKRSRRTQNNDSSDSDEESIQKN